MVQLVDEVPNERMFHKEYPYRTSGSAAMRAHFERVARRFLETELIRDGSFIVEIGCNDGAMLSPVAAAGTRHLGVEPCGDLADIAASKGIQVLNQYFDEWTAQQIIALHGPADVIFSANTLSHISYLGSVFRGVDALLAPEGVFVFEDPYFLDIVEKVSFDQIYDEHVYFFTVRSIQAAAAQYGLALVDVERISQHGGEVRYTVAREGARTPSPAIAELLDAERAADLIEWPTLQHFARKVADRADALVALLRDLKDAGKRVVGYGATAKSSTLMNYCGIGPDLVSSVYDNTPTKQGKYTPGSHIPVLGPDEFDKPYPDFALLFAWNHAAEIMARLRPFREAGGKWIMYVPDVHLA
jgi:methylation protein EvaC